MKLIWLAIAIGFGIAEAMTASLALIWFSISAVIMIFLSSIVESIVLQLIIYGGLSTTMLIIATNKFIKKDENYKYDTNLQGILNEKGIVKKEIQSRGSGIVSVRGEEWTAISIGEETILEDEYVKILKIEGVKLVVEKI